MTCDFETTKDLAGYWHHCRACGKVCVTQGVKHYARCGKTEKRGVCLYRGDEVDRVRCNECGGGVMVKVFACEIWGRCTIQKNVGEKVCQTCQEYQHG
jgi:hypothetical protein